MCKSAGYRPCHWQLEPWSTRRIVWWVFDLGAETCLKSRPLGVVLGVSCSSRALDKDSLAAETSTADCD
jgi:hypothetical protein